MLKTKIARNAVGKGVCTLPGMPKGTKLKLQYELKGKWYTLGTGRAPGTMVPFVYGFEVPAPTTSAWCSPRATSSSPPPGRRSRSW